MSTSQLASPKFRNSVRTQFIASDSLSHLTTKERTASIRSKLWARISAPLKSTGRSSSVSTSLNRTCVPTTRTVTPVYVNTNGGCSPENSKTIRGWCVSQWPIELQNLSADELMFVSHIYNWGLSTANYLAAKSHYKLRQPLPVLLAALCELDKNCTKRSEARVQPSNARASSSKRSSGA